MIQKNGGGGEPVDGALRCEQVRELTPTAVDTPLPPEIQTKYDEHLESCSECGERAAQLKVGLAAIASLPRHPVPRSFAADVLSRVESSSDEASTPENSTTRSNSAGLLPSSSRRREWRALLAVAAAFLIGVVVAFFYFEFRYAERETQWRLAQTEFSDLKGQIDGLVADVREDRTSSRERAEDSDARLVALAEDLAEFRRAAGEQKEAAQRFDSILAAIETQLTSGAERDRVLEQRLVELATNLETNAETMTDDSSEQPLQPVDMIALTERLQALEDRLTTIGDELASRSSGASPLLLASASDPGGVQALRMQRSGDQVILEPNWEHPRVYEMLFEVYERGDPDYAPIAYAHLERSFAKRAEGFVARSRQVASERDRGFFGSMFEPNAEPTDPRQEEQDLVHLWRQYWQSQRGQGSTAAWSD